MRRIIRGKVSFTEFLRGKAEDLRAWHFPGVQRKARLAASLLQKTIGCPTAFRGYSRKQEPAEIILDHQQPVLADFDLSWLNRFHRRQD